MGRGRSEKTTALVHLAREILEEIQPASVRAVCYQLFIQGAIPSMEKTQTNRVGTLLTRAPVRKATSPGTTSSRRGAPSSRSRPGPIPPSTRRRSRTVTAGTNGPGSRSGSSS
jgi:hypothetical protein